jgi:hypothetical protein
MDAELVKISISLFNLLLTCAVGIFAWTDRKHRATTESIKDLEKVMMKKFDAKEVRLAKIEADLKVIPAREELIRIHERIDSENKVIRGEFGKMNERLDKIVERSTESSQNTSLLLGQVLGQLKQINEGKS